MLVLLLTPDHPPERSCLNCVRYLPCDQWSGHCEEWDSGTEPDDRCERWDGE